MNEKLINLALGAASGLIAEKCVDLLWRGITHRESPNAEDPTEPLRDVLVFTVVSSVVSAVLNELTVRKVASWQAKRIGGAKA